jgi:hypothetical protein
MGMIDRTIFQFISPRVISNTIFTYGRFANCFILKIGIIYV